MAILVTGGAGYIGSITVEHLRSRGDQIVVLDNLSRGHREAVDASVRFYQGDIGDSDLVSRITLENQIESCIHFAAFACADESVKWPELYFENNVVQGLTLFSALLRAGVRRLVFASSCATYGEPETLPVKENARQHPTSPYGWSKLLLERALVAYDMAHGMKFVALRYFNAAGAAQTRGEEHEPETHLIPNVLHAASNTDHVAVFGDTYATPDGTAIRDYVHVVDLAEAHASALDYLRQGGPSEFLNLGIGHGHSVMEVIECARRVTGKPIRTLLKPSRPGDPSCLIADASRAKRVLGWTARQSDLTTIVRTAWQWLSIHQRSCVTR